MKKTYNLYKVAAIVATFFIASCSTNNTENKVSSSVLYEDTFDESIYTVDTIKELTDTEYPNNPDIAIKSRLDRKFSHNKIEITRTSQEYFTLVILPENNESDTVIFADIKLLEWIPSVPTFAKEDSYLEQIGIINQEWNRMQVNFKNEQFIIKGKNLESKKLTRVDLARNCINAYLWELIFYTKENGKSKPCYHGWFDFPKDLYANLFEEKNNISYEDYREQLENWIDPESKEINLGVLRNIESSTLNDFKNYNASLFPLQGERKKKKMNIMVPNEQKSINNFLTDSTLFATFSAPGFYNQLEPRKTQLQRLANITSTIVNKTTSKNEIQNKGLELVLNFQNETDTTKFIIGGLNIKNIPTLSVKDVNKGYQMPMGIGNHSFYTNYAQIETSNSLQSPYYAFLLDQNNNWLDSHTIGIDGPMLHFDDKNPNLLHIWILSFERHCFVGHYTIDLENKLS
jgi:hypothetical protein